MIWKYSMYNAALIILSLIVADLPWMIHEIMMWKLKKEKKRKESPYDVTTGHAHIFDYLHLWDD